MHRSIAIFFLVTCGLAGLIVAGCESGVDTDGAAWTVAPHAALGCLTPPCECQASSDCPKPSHPCVHAFCLDGECREKWNGVMVDGEVVSATWPICCTTDAECGEQIDSNPCLVPKCQNVGSQGSGTCTYQMAEKPGCCDPKESSAACQDGNGCTYDPCFNYQCFHVEIAECCSATDAPCDDEDPCTADACDLDAYLCQHDAKPGPCCGDALDCDDGDPCTADACVGPSTQVSGTCAHQPLAGCCATDQACDDGKSCTLDLCVNAACDDNDAATYDACINGWCRSYPLP